MRILFYHQTSTGPLSFPLTIIIDARFLPQYYHLVASTIETLWRRWNLSHVNCWFILLPENIEKKMPKHLSLLSFLQWNDQNKQKHRNHMRAHQNLQLHVSFSMPRKCNETNITSVHVSRTSLLLCR